MTYLGRLLRVELAAQISLAACALLFAIVLVAAMSFLGLNGSSEDAGPAMDALVAGAFLSMMVYLYCVGPVTLVIAPIYAALEARNWATAVTSICVGLVPGTLMLIYSVSPLLGSESVGTLVQLGCLPTGASIATGLHLVRTWNQS